MRLAAVLSRTFGIWNTQLTLAMNKQFLHIDTQMGAISLNDPVWVTKFSNSFKVSKTFTMYLTANYQSSGDYRNVHLTRHVWTVNFNATKSFCHDLFSVQIKANDIFNTQKDGNRVYSERMTMDLLNTYDFRAVSLTLRYNFNDKSDEQHSHSNVNEELRRF